MKSNPEKSKELKENIIKNYKDVLSNGGSFQELRIMINHVRDLGRISKKPFNQIFRELIDNARGL